MDAKQAKAAINSIRSDLEAAYPIRLVGIFGSVVRGAARPGNDVDILAEPGPA
jgi:predicted nucleotidyltransferase